jgi:hypothetical protein
MTCFYWVLGSLVAGVLGGGYLHYRYGSTVVGMAKDVAGKLP